LNLPDRAVAAERLGLDPRLQTLVITGASQGAQTVNEAVVGALPQLNLQGWQVLHLAGRDHGEKVRAAYREINIAARVIDFTPGMADIWAVADVAVSRSGASSCAELTACGIPSVLMPYPFHKDLHQRANAKVLADANAAILLDDAANKKANAEKLTPVLASLLYDLSRRQGMAVAARKLGRPDAADAVARVVLEMLRA
jgi:UDP-N-acetylglucosamine--N-acetylmuramyl-(pentapeptide) pyrophosphoryl-undecaprenol N-acetylglucosamine transferase